MGCAGREVEVRRREMQYAIRPFIPEGGGREDGGRGYGHETWARACRRAAEVRPTYYTELFYSGTVGYTLLSGFSGRCHGLRISNAVRLYSNKVEGVSPR